MSTSAALWAAVLGVGAWHGLNPGMGWPLAVAQGLTARRGSALLATFGALGAGHLLAMALVLLPFSLLAGALDWGRALRLAAGVPVLLFGLYRLLHRRHPRLLARVPPTRLVLWSFLVAQAHGAGLMLLPFALGLCAPAAGAAPAGSAPAAALLVALVHTGAMLAAGLAVAWFVYRHAALHWLRRGWLDLDGVWGASLVLAGASSVGLAWAGA